MSAIPEQTSVGEDWAIDKTPEVLTRIYEDSISIAIWQRLLQQDTQTYLSKILTSPRNIALKLSGAPDQLMGEIQRVFPPAIISAQQSCVPHACISASAFYADIHQVLDMFACLFDAKVVGLRINTLDKAMCPRFHTDNVAVRLITTYYGIATEWLPGGVAERSALGTDFASEINTSGAIMRDEKSIQRMSAGDVALLKGELWEGNEGRGIIHRSPALTPAQPKRLVMTCDLLH